MECKFDISDENVYWWETGHGLDVLAKQQPRKKLTRR